MRAAILKCDVFELQYQPPHCFYQEYRLVLQPRERPAENSNYGNVATCNKIQNPKSSKISLLKSGSKIVESGISEFKFILRPYFWTENIFLKRNPGPLWILFHGPRKDQPIFNISIHIVRLRSVQTVHTTYKICHIFSPSNLKQWKAWRAFCRTTDAELKTLVDPRTCSLHFKSGDVKTPLLGESH